MRLLDPGRCCGMRFRHPGWFCGALAVPALSGVEGARGLVLLIREVTLPALSAVEGSGVEGSGAEGSPPWRVERLAPFTPSLPKGAESWGRTEGSTVAVPVGTGRAGSRGPTGQEEDESPTKAQSTEMRCKHPGRVSGIRFLDPGRCCGMRCRHPGRVSGMFFFSAVSATLR